MAEWLLLTVLAAAPIQSQSDTYETRDQCLAAGRQWYAQVLAVPETKARCDTVIGGNRCKFACVAGPGTG